MRFLRNWTYYLLFIVIIILVSYVLNYLDHYFQKDLSIVVRNSANDTALYKKVNPFKFRNININSTNSSNKTKNILENSLSAKKDTHKYYTLQVGSFRNRKDAQSQARRYNKLGYKANISKVDLSEKGIWYRIFIGNFETRQEALTYAKHLSRKLGIENPWVHAMDKQ